MSGDRGYASVPERITWTTGFRSPTDALVLGALSTFANFETGKGARMSVKKLCARAGLKRSTVLRALRRLEADGWIVATRHHRHATVRDIVVDRLAPHWMVAKLVGGVDRGFPQSDKNLSVIPDTQLSVNLGTQLSVNSDTQTRDLSVKYDTQAADLSVISDTQLSVNFDTPIPCTERTPVQQIGSPVKRNPSAPALRAGSRGTDDENPGDADAPQPATRTADLRADGHPHHDDGVSDLPGRRSDHPAALGPRVPLRHGPDSPSPQSLDRPGAGLEPTQPGLGLLADVNAPIGVTPSEQQHRQFMQDLRARVGLSTAADVDEEKTG
jgi:hypothetical protein